MIFAVAGTQLPFPRLMRALDAIAARRGLEVVAQTADPGFAAVALDARPFMAPDAFDDHVRRAAIVVAHAGMGVIIAAAEHNKPLILMGRKASLGEHRNDHQLATVRRFAGLPGLRVVEDEAGLEVALAELADDPRGLDLAASPMRASLIAALRQAIG